MKKFFGMLAVLAAAITIGLSVSPAAHATTTRPTCASDGGITTGYDYAGFDSSSNLIAVGSYAQTNVTDFGSSLSPADTNHGGHVATWIGEQDGDGHWIQVGVNWFNWSLTDPTGQTGTFAVQAFDYIEVHDDVYPYEHLTAWPVAENVWETAKLSRSATHTYTASIAGHSVSKTWGSGTNMTDLQLEGENFQNNVDSPEPCNIADEGFENTVPSGLIVNANYSTTHSAKFDMQWSSGTANYGVFLSPWNLSGGCGAPVGPDVGGC